MEENKYFTPDIRDFRIGYIAEWLQEINTPNEYWEEKALIPHNLTSAFNYIFSNSSKDVVRTSYLTKEQIKNEGWKNLGAFYLFDVTQDKSIGDDNTYRFKKENYEIYYRDTTNILKIKKGEDWLYQGECKSINEFKYICKLLNIN